MYPGLPSRLEKEMKQLYLTRVLNSDPSRLNVRYLSPSILLQLTLITDSIEIQNPNRRSSTPKAHGFPRGCCTGRHHERTGRILDNKRRVVRTGREVT